MLKGSAEAQPEEASEVGAESGVAGEMRVGGAAEKSLGRRPHAWVQTEGT